MKITIRILFSPRLVSIVLELTSTTEQEKERKGLIQGGEEVKLSLVTGNTSMYFECCEYAKNH